VKCDTLFPTIIIAFRGIFSLFVPVGSRNDYWTRWLYCVECPQYSIALEALGICATVELSYNVFFKLNDLHISTSFCTSNTKKVPIRVPVRRNGAYRQKKHWNSRHRCVANVPVSTMLRSELYYW